MLSSGVAGTMAANGSGLQLSDVRNIALAWVLTLPAAMMLSGWLYFVFRIFSEARDRFQNCRERASFAREDGMRAMDVMVHDVVTFRPETDFVDAVKLLNEHDVSALPGGRSRKPAGRHFE